MTIQDQIYAGECLQETLSQTDGLYIREPHVSIFTIEAVVFNIEVADLPTFI